LVVVGLGKQVRHRQPERGGDLLGLAAGMAVQQRPPVGAFVHAQ